MSARWTGAALAAAVITVAGSARATPVLELLGAPGGTGGLQAGSSGPSAASAYFNPAMLSDASEDMLIGFGLLSEQVSLELNGRRAGADVPLSVGSRDVVDKDGNPVPNDTLPTQWLQQGCTEGPAQGQCPAPAIGPRPRQGQGTSNNTRTYLLLGGVKHLVRDRFSVGLYIALPLGNLTTAQSFYADEREQLFSNSLHPELYGDRLTAVSIALGGSFRLFKSLSLGLGTTFALANSAVSSTYIRDSTNYDTLLLNNDVQTTAALSPHVGVYWTPTSWLRVGGSVHAPQSFEIDESISATLPDGVQSGTTKKQVHDFMPWRARVGAEVDLVRSSSYTFGVAGSLLWANWSSYQDRHGDSPGSYSGPGTDLSWSDTVTYTIGVRHRYKRVRGYADFQIAPSPVPLQVGRSNYVDCDRYGFAVGADLEIPLGNVRLRPGLQLVGYRLAWRHQTKDDRLITDEVPDGSRFGSTGEAVVGSRGLQTNNPGWPGFGESGWVYGGTATMDVLF